MSGVAAVERPTALPVKPEGIPDELKALPQWVVWRYKFKDGRWTKVPYMAKHPQRNAKSTDPATWATFAEALAAYERGEFDGVGFVPVGTDPYTAFDIDKCRDPVTGVLAPWVVEILEKLKTRAEVSPSGTGVRAFVKGRLKVTADGEPTDRTRSKTGDFEVYDGLTADLVQGGRYVTVTGHRLNEFGIEERQAELEQLYDKIFNQEDKKGAGGSAARPGANTTDLIEKIRASKQGAKFERLWQGDASSYRVDDNNGHSEADLALCSILGWWTNYDVSETDTLFRQSGLYRPKWDEARGAQTYGELTIANAFKDKAKGDGYDPNSAQGPQMTFTRSASGEASEEEPWGNIAPLTDPNPPAPPLPAELIPEALRGWLVDVAERLCVPVEIPAAAAIVAAGGILGRGVGIYPQRYDDWLVYANFWGGVTAKPGMMKSPLIAEATKGARRIEAEAAETFDKEAAAHDARRERLELEIEACRKRMKEAIAKRHDTTELEADMVHLKDQANAVPQAARRLVVQDSTVEKLGELLQANPRGLLLLRDELAGWLRSLERPGREGDREFYLETWSGDGVYTFDRIKRGTIRIPQLCLSVFGGIQPGKLKRYIQDATTGGEGADGLLQRLQIIVWPESLGEWVNTDRRPDREAWERARKVFDALATYDAAALGLKADEDGRAGLRFSAEAQEVFYLWRGDIERRVRGGELDSTPAFASHISKYRSLMPGLALLFHLIGLADGPHDHESISQDDARLAADWCDYLETHARRVYHGELERVALASHAIVAKIDEGEIKHKMTVRDIYRTGWEDLSDRATVLEALETLVERNYLRVVEEPTGGRPTAVIHLHPGLRP